MTDTDHIRRPRVHVVGIGGAGTNGVHRLVNHGLRGARTIALNTDWEHLGRTNADRKVLLGDGEVHSTGGRPDYAVRLALRHEREIRRAVGGGDLTFLMAGLGGGTGTGIAPLVAKWCRSSGALVVGIATMPFRAERVHTEIAGPGLEALRAQCNSLVVLENERLARVAPSLPMEEALAVMDHLVGEVVRGIVHAMYGPSLIQLDFPDVHDILQNGDLSTVLVGEGDVHDPEGVVNAAMDNAFIEGDPTNATGAVLHITAGPEVAVQTLDRVVGGMTRRISRNAKVAFGVRTDPDFAGSMRLMSVLTGVGGKSLLDALERQTLPGLA